MNETGRSAIGTSNRVFRGRIGEGITIVASILLAFGVDAWWDRGRERRELASLEELVEAQMLENRMVLASEIEGAQSAQRALESAVAIISPKPPDVPPDSLWNLLDAAWGLSDRALETSALERLLGSELFDPAARPALNRHMVNFRMASGFLSRNAERFVEVKVRTTDRILTLSPLPTGPSGFWNVPDPGEPFPDATHELLSDAHLEGLVKQMHRRHRIRGQLSTELDALADSITRGVRRARE
jgi:hypothetical protein